MRNDHDQTGRLGPYLDWALDERGNRYRDIDTDDVAVRSNKVVSNNDQRGLFGRNLAGSAYQPCTGGCAQIYLWILRVRRRR